MLERTLDRYDEISYFISHHEEKLGRDNLGALRGIMVVISYVYGFMLFTLFFFQMNYKLNVGYFYPVIVLLVYHTAHKYLEEKFCSNFDKTRIFCIFWYYMITMTLCYVDVAFQAEGRAVFFVIAVLVESILYIDHYFVQFIHKCCLFFSYFILCLVVQNTGYSGSDVRIALAVIIISMFCDTYILGTHADQGSNTRIYEEKSQIDLLTGLYNKLSFEEKSKRYLESRADGEECSLFILDFDNFKNVNDTYGHQIGDEALKAFGKILQSDFRASDIVGRVGGDEFMVLVTGGMPEGYIKKRCDFVQHELNILHIDHAKGFSCSIGVAVDNTGATFETMYHSADAALYRAKKNGKARFEENRLGA